MAGESGCLDTNEAVCSFLASQQQLWRSIKPLRKVSDPAPNHLITPHVWHQGRLLSRKGDWPGAVYVNKLSQTLLPKKGGGMPRQQLFSFMLYFEKLCYFFHRPVPVLREPYLPVGRGEQGLDLQLNLFIWWNNVMWYLKRCLMSCMLFSKVSAFSTFFLARAPSPQGEPTLVKVPKPTGIRAAMHVTFDCPHFETEQQLQQRLQLRFWVKNWEILAATPVFSIIGSP